MREESICLLEAAERKQNGPRTLENKNPQRRRRRDGHVHEGLAVNPKEDKI